MLEINLPAKKAQVEKHAKLEDVWKVTYNEYAVNYDELKMKIAKAKAQLNQPVKGTNIANGWTYVVDDLQFWLSVLILMETNSVLVV